jgi:NAD+ synthase
MEINILTEKLITWIKDWFEKNGKGCNAVIGISGGKDSTIAAALCVKALGKERVIGVLMPQHVQNDIKDSIDVCNYLDIKYYQVNIGPTVDMVKKSIGFDLSEQANTNLPARIRMSTLYAISQTVNGRVVNTCNLSENYVSYETKFGDGAGDFSPLGNLTVREILQIGDYLNLPTHLVHKIPMDGLNRNSDGSYVTDEQNLGFSYDELDEYLLNGVKPSKDKLEKIEQLHQRGIAKNKMLVFEK